MLSRLLGTAVSFAKSPRKHVEQPGSVNLIQRWGASACFRGGVVRILSLHRSRESMAPEIHYTALISQQALRPYFGQRAQRLWQRHHLHAFMYPVSFHTRIDDPGPVQFQISQGDVEGFCHIGSVAGLEFHTVAAALAEQDQVQFRAGVGAPVIGMIRSGRGQHLFQGVTFPG